MTNYINSITLEDGSTYGIGPYGIIGTNNIVGRYTNVDSSSIDGSNNTLLCGDFSISGNNCLVIGPQSASGYISGNDVVVVTNSVFNKGDTPIYGINIGGGSRLVRSQYNINIGDKVIVYPESISIGCLDYTVSTDITLPCNINVRIPCELLMVGHYCLSSETLNGDYSSAIYGVGATTSIYYSINGNVVVAGDVFTLSGSDYYGWQYSSSPAGRIGVSVVDNGLSVVIHTNVESLDTFSSARLDWLTIKQLGFIQ